MADLNDTAAEISRQLQAHGFEDDGGIYQVLALVEEAGEMVGAYRRWTGRARRTGTEQEFRLELADVVITAFVTAAELAVRLDTPELFLVPQPLEPAAAWPNVLHTQQSVSVFVAAWLASYSDVWLPHLQQTVERSYLLAGALGLDLNADIQTKLDIVFNRGWRELAKAGRKDGVAILPDPVTRTAWQSEFDQ
jgi:NTP pyrophosphatase (non-canonical NTP hydrolase)